MTTRRKRERRPALRCDVCGAAKAHLHRVTRSYGSGKDLLVIENIPVVSCAACGQSYMTAETLHELDRLKRHRHKLATGRRVEVVSFAA